MEKIAWEIKNPSHNNLMTIDKLTKDSLRILLSDENLRLTHQNIEKSLRDIMATIKNSTIPTYVTKEP